MLNDSHGIVDHATRNLYNSEMYFGESEIYFVESEMYFGESEMYFGESEMYFGDSGMYFDDSASHDSQTPSEMYSGCFELHSAALDEMKFEKYFVDSQLYSFDLEENAEISEDSEMRPGNVEIHSGNFVMNFEMNSALHFSRVHYDL